MKCWQTTVAALFAALFLFLSFSDVETKKKKKSKWPLQEETLQQQCNEQQSAGSRHSSSRKNVNNILKLQAFFDLTKGFACLKVETCSSDPVCFVEDTPNLGHENLSDCTLWKQLLRGLKTNRKIEPVFENHVNTRNTGKARTDNSWNEAVSSLCHGANVYRFVSGNRGAEDNSTLDANEWSATPENASNIDTGSPDNGNTRRNATVSSTGKPFNRKRERRSSRRNMRRTGKKAISNTNSNNNQTVAGSFSQCEGLDEGCTRICVGQNEKLTNVSNCTTFRINCTFRKMFKRSTRRKNKNRNRKKNSKSDK